MSAEILIVDDEKNIREYLQDSLELEGCGVGAVDGGEVKTLLISSMRKNMT